MIGIIKAIILIFISLLPLSVVFTQTTVYYAAYQTSFLYVTTCPTSQYYDIALLQCSPCPANAVQKLTDVTQCDCTNTTFYYRVNQGGGSVLCSSCSSGVRTMDGFGCTVVNTTCDTTNSSLVLSESDLDGTLYNSNPSAAQPRSGNDTCLTCVAGTLSDQNDQRCAPCANNTPQLGTLPGTINCCPAGSSALRGGVCLSNVINGTGVNLSPIYYNTYNSPAISAFFQANLDASLYLCLMNLNPTTAQSSTRLLLANVTACQVLANIATMQFYYPASNYAYNLYQTYIWQGTSTQLWTASSIRTAIPFLAYPSTYYSEITNASYNWIPSTFNQGNLLRLKLAKYSPTGKYLGLFDAFDAYMQLCGGAYTDGKPAFTFGTQYSRTCSIRAEALWNSTLYETAFFDPYLMYTRSGSDYLIPVPVVIRNYKTDQGLTPNQNDDESAWIYHRRFFLLDRVSGVTVTPELRNIHYAKSITILNTLANGAAYITPPTIVIQYDELSLSDLGKGTVVQVSFNTQYRMNLDTHIRSIWIAIGVLSGIGLIIAFIRTMAWQSRAGKDIIDLMTIGKFCLHLINAIGTFFFIVMAGVSLWWLVFFKRQDAVYLVIPSSMQQASFTVLVVVAFILKTLDILHLIVQQANIDIFFIDWEKPKRENPSTVSAWRSYFIANEFNELQVFRYINVTFQLIFVLFLLKVINLENVATIQPGVSLFPSSADYIPPFNGMLRVGIAFSMWLATGLIQYLIYILFYQRFVEDQIINFIDLCSVSNISVFILLEKHYGYYIHGRSPYEKTDVNMKEMMGNLEGETNRKIGTRGLQPNSDDQAFIVRVDKAFRAQYELLLQNYRNRILTHLTKKGEEHESEILLASYRHLNDFLCAFINHSLPAYTYLIRARRLLEKILNYEFHVINPADVSGPTESMFFIDIDRNFTQVIFAGYENSLFIWNMSVFLFVDYFAMNYILAAIITYLLNMIAVKLRLSLGRKNLAKKTLIPKSFLI